MKNRIFALSLALVLLLTAVPFPVNAAEKPIFQVLVEFIQKNGERESVGELTWSYSYSVKSVVCENSGETGSVELLMQYFPWFQMISLHLMIETNLEDCCFDMQLNQDGTISTCVLWGPWGDASYGSVTVITNTSLLRATEYMGGEGRHEQMDKLASTMLKTELEMLQVILKQEGRTIADLGFTAYVPGHRHSWVNGKVIRQPTCGNCGEKEFTCPACNGLFLGFVQPTGQHTWDQGKVEEKPTCAHNGVYVYTCTVCGERKGKTIPATGQHTWYRDRITTEPTCTQPGVAHYLCSVCWGSKDESVPALGHAWALTEVTAEGDTLHDSTGHYVCTRCEESKEASLCAAEVFTDMPKQSHWAHDAIDWAYYNRFTGGTSYNTFSPSKVVTRGEVVTFLHTLEGKPEAEAENPFTDVKKKDFYYDAVLWAVANDITKGTTDTTFSPKNTCTRAEIVMFLWAAAGRPEPENTENRFQDVKAKDYFRTAVLWAVENGITGGIDETHFGPKVNCTRAQVMLFLKAAYPILTAEETPEQPEDPTEPTEPEDPTEPTEPEDPTEPTEPAPDPETP